MSVSRQQTFWPEAQVRSSIPTFGPNQTEPVHRWFRYSAGFSATWVNSVIRSVADTNAVRVLDPFAGSGTVLLESEQCGHEARGLESQPFVARVARTKLLWWRDPDIFESRVHEVLAAWDGIKPDLSVYPPLILKCYPPQTLESLDRLRQAIANDPKKDDFTELSWLALAAILRSCSPVGTASWQYILPKKTKSHPTQAKPAFIAKVRQMTSDMRSLQSQVRGPRAEIAEYDCRRPDAIPEGWATFVITSPPYANNFDYGDATRLEMSFFLEIRGWGDLQSSARKNLVRSCTQHVAGFSQSLDDVLGSPLLDPLRPDIERVCGELAIVKLSKGGRKQYDLMIATYFSDLAVVWKNLRRWTVSDAKVCFVIGDSAPYGVHVPVDDWLGKLAVAAGFESYRFEKLRDRNIKWKNRKHRVPLHEGLLWVN